MSPPEYLSSPRILPEDGPDARVVLDEHGNVLAIRRTGGALRPVDPEFDAATRTSFGEARGEGVGGMAAVGSVIKNRRDQSGQTVREIVLAPHQFDAWTQQRKRLSALRTDDPGYQAAAEAILPVFSGEARDPTNGATEFFNPAHVPATYRAGEGVIIGNHKFVSGYWKPPRAPPAPHRFKAPSPFSEDDLPPVRPIGSSPPYWPR